MQRLAFAAAIVLSLGLCQPVFADTPSLYMHASEANLRAKPTTKSDIAGKVKIGTVCSNLGDEGNGWVHLKCGDVEGYTLAKFLQPTPPDPAALLATATDSNVAPGERLNAALRSAALVSSPESLAAVSTAFLDVEHQNLADHIKAKGASKGREVTLSCREKSVRDCTVGALKEAKRDFLVWDPRGSSFVAVAGVGPTLHVVTGTLSRPEPTTTRVVVAAHQMYLTAGVLSTALQAVALESKGGYADILSPKASRTLTELPQQWALLSGSQGSPRFKEECGYGLPVTLNVGLDDSAVFPAGRVTTTEYEGGADLPAVGVEKAGSIFTMTTQGSNRKGATSEATIEWPFNGNKKMAQFKYSGATLWLGQWVGEWTNRDQAFPIAAAAGCDDGGEY